MRKDLPINDLSWAETVDGYDRGELIFFVDRGLAVRAAANGLRTHTFGTIAGLIAPVFILVGIALALFVAWWWLPVGIVVAVVGFRISRQTAVNAVRKAALEDERIFYFFRDKRIIWFERS